MVPNDIWLRTEWLSCRRTSVLRCVERYCAAAAREYRRALRRVQEVEETMAQVEPETGRRLPSQPAQAELLNRRLAAANAEIRRYQTRLYACEREMVALRQENAELEALCEQARANSLLPPVPPQPKVLEQPGLPVIGLTAHAMPEERQRCLSSGMVAHVSKPIDCNSLIATILQYVALPSSVSAARAGGLIDWAALSERYRGRG